MSAPDPGAAARIFLVPSETLGRVEDVFPERLASPANDWIAHTREVLRKKRQAAARGQWKPDVPIGEGHAHLKAFGAEHCPAMAELDSIGFLLKWPATAVLRQVTPKGWEIKPSTNFNFYGYSPRTTFPEAGEAESITVDTGFTVVAPPGWSVLFKNVPNALAGSPKGLVFAEGIVRADQATFPLKVHVFIRTNAKEVKIRRGDPMAVLMPFRRETVDLAVMSDPAFREETARLSQADRDAFDNAPGGYRRLYVEDDNPSPLYPRLEAAFEARRRDGTS